VIHGRKVAVVTGGASGIGEGTVRRLISDGFSVVAADIQGEAAAALAAECGERCRAITTDVASEDDVAAAVDLAVAEFGQLDLMFANAGIFGAYGPVEKSKMADVDLTWAVDLRGVFLAMKHAARVMIPRGTGVIVATTSPAAVLGGIGNHAYSAAKAGVLGLMRSVAAELREHGIRVNAVMPGAVVSAMTADLRLGDAAAIDRATQTMARDAPLGRPGLPADVAAAVSFLASDDAAFITGHTVVVDGGLSALRTP